MRNLILVGLIVAVGLTAGCQQTSGEPAPTIYPPGPVATVQPADNVPPPPQPMAVATEPVIRPPEPIQPAPIPAEPTEQVHVVVKDDTLWKIARKYYGPNPKREQVQKIIHANPGINPDRIFPGQKIIVPR